jgi:hypothetical protein
VRRFNRSGNVKLLFQKDTKKQTLLLEGDICTYNAFIEKGFYARTLLMKKE